MIGADLARRAMALVGASEPSVEWPVTVQWLRPESSTNWYETFQHGDGQTYEHFIKPLVASYTQAIKESAKQKEMFWAFLALPDERMKPQKVFFVGSACRKPQGARWQRQARRAQPQRGTPGHRKLRRGEGDRRLMRSPLGRPRHFEDRQDRHRAAEDHSDERQSTAPGSRRAENKHAQDEGACANGGRGEFGDPPWRGMLSPRSN